MTTLVKWTPFREFDLMERNMRRLFGLNLAPVLPVADIYETKDEFVFELEVPGYEEKDLAIEISDHVLTVRGEHNEKTEEKDKAFHLHERLEREFERRFELPSTIETEKLTATFKQGVLELHAPKAEQLVPKKIPITIS
jgi:HSP20 family protein